MNHKMKSPTSRCGSRTLRPPCSEVSFTALHPNAAKEKQARRLPSFWRLVGALWRRPLTSAAAADQAGAIKASRPQTFSLAAPLATIIKETLEHSGTERLDVCRNRFSV